MVGEALQYTHEELNLESEGLGVDAEGNPHKTTVIVITDGKATDEAKIQDSADTIKNQPNVFVYAVGVGGGFSEEQLTVIATEDKLGRYVKPVSSFEDLLDRTFIAEVVADVLHKPCCIFDRFRGPYYDSRPKKRSRLVRLTKVMTLDDCVAQCNAIEACFSFSYKQRRNFCFLSKGSAQSDAHTKEEWHYYHEDEECITTTTTTPTTTVTTTLTTTATTTRTTTEDNRYCNAYGS
eukprot:gene22458-14634_t